MNPTNELPNIRFNPVRKLDQTNPLDWARLLWWAYIARYRLIIHVNLYGALAHAKVGAWLVSTLIWLPFFIPVSVLVFNQNFMEASRRPGGLWILLLGVIFFSWRSMAINMIKSVTNTAQNEGFLTIGLFVVMVYLLLTINGMYRDLPISFIVPASMILAFSGITIVFLGLSPKYIFGAIWVILLATIIGKAKWSRGIILILYPLPYIYLIWLFYLGGWLQVSS